MVRASGGIAGAPFRYENGEPFYNGGVRDVAELFAVGARVEVQRVGDVAEFRGIERIGGGKVEVLIPAWRG